MHCTLKSRLYCKVPRKVPKEIKAAERTRAVEKPQNKENILMHAPVTGQTGEASLNVTLLACNLLCLTLK